MPTPSIDPSDVQGLLRFGYARMTEACYLLLRIRDKAAARAWCSTAPVATAEIQAKPPDVALQVASTWTGLRTLGVPANVLAGFSAEFQSGMASDENRSRRLGDVGTSAPAAWDLGGPDQHSRPSGHAFRRARATLAEWRRHHADAAFHAMPLRV